MALVVSRQSEYQYKKVIQSAEVLEQNSCSKMTLSIQVY